ncbi:MAG: efflux RND transporter periplasmic adaptor subunit [Lentisphaeria bacterium]|nr:efflux RND transporter periplasmic adaptor subunit [Lentisphaeria bacterium]
MKYPGIIAVILLCCGALSAREKVRTVLFPRREAVLASRVESRLLPCTLRVGESFPAGAELLKLDDRRYVLEYKRTSAQYDFHEAAFETKRKLREKSLTSDFELKKAEFDKHMSRAAMDRAGLDLAACTVKAPFPGKLAELITREYETVRPGQELCRIIDDRTLMAVMNVPAGDEKLTAAGNTVKIRMDDGKVISGRIYEVSPQADHRTGTRRIRVEIDNSRGVLTAGTTGELLYDR